MVGPDAEETGFCTVLYGNADRVSWVPNKIFGDEIWIISSFSEVFIFPQTIDYLDSRNPRTKRIVNKVFWLD